MSKEKLANLLPEELKGAILCADGLREVRIRAYSPVRIICADGISQYEFCPTAKEVTAIAVALSDFSVYAHSDELAQGFFTIDGGVRVGVSGQASISHGKISFPMGFSSLVIRFPCEVIGCGHDLEKSLFCSGDNILNTLIISPPGAGKTTLLRDIARILASEPYSKNVVIIDERGELAFRGSEASKHCDVISGVSRAQGMGMAVRTLCPEVIVTDEIGSECDLAAVAHAGNCGVAVIASAHAKNFEGLKRKAGFNNVAEMFGVLVELSEKNGKGTIENIFTLGCET